MASITEIINSRAGELENKDGSSSITDIINQKANELNRTESSLNITDLINKKAKELDSSSVAIETTKEPDLALDTRYKEFLQDREYQKKYLANKDAIDALVEKTQQNELRAKYASQYPELFKDGKLINLEKAKSEGIVYESSSDLEGKPLAEPIIKFASPSEIEQSKNFELSQDDSFRSKAPSIDQQIKQMLTIPDRDVVSERYTTTQPTKMVEVDFDTYLQSDAFQNRMKDSPILEKYYTTFGETGARFLASISSGALYVRGGAADLYKMVHDSVDEATDGGASQTIGMDSKTAAKAFVGDVGQILEVGEKGAMMSLLSRVPKATQLATDIFDAEVKRKKNILKNAAKIKKIEGRRLNINRAKSAEALIATKKAEDALKKANENQSIKEELIMDYEAQIGARDINNVNKIIDEDKLISKTIAGKLSIDYDKARIVGQRIAEREYTGAVDIDGDLIAAADLEETIGVTKDSLLSPIIIPDKLDPLVAIASELKKSKPDAFPKGKMTIDNLFNATIKGDLLPSDELTTLLNKYDVSFEEYIAMVLGSASQAGKVLQKFSVIAGRKTGARGRKEAMERANLERYNFAGKATLRFIDIGRGALVSMLTTMIRNVDSTLIRSPMETLSNVFNTALYNLTEKGLKKKAFTVLSPTNWRNSFKHNNYLLDNKDARDYTDYILNRPEFMNKYNVLFSNVSELVRLRRPEGIKLGPVATKVDQLLEAGEDFVDTLNIPNKWQDYITRNAYFLSSMEDLFKKNYNGLDLIDEINAGRVKEILTDSPTILPKDAKPFAEIVAEATEKARNATYSNVPNFIPFKVINEILAKYGGTAIVAFPRFVFTSIELMAQYSGGIALVPIRRLIRPNRLQKLTDRDREDISRNLTGFAIYLAANGYRKPESERPAWMQGYFGEPHPDYKYIRTAEGESFDTTALFPLRQALYMIEFVNRAREGTLAGSLIGDPITGAKEFSETFFGATLRAGRGTSMIEDFINALGGADASWEDRISKVTGTAFGNFVQRYAVPAAQIIDLERGLSKLPEIRVGQDGKLIDFGLIEGRPSEIKDANIDPTYGDFQSSFATGFKMPFIRRGFISPSAERELPNRKYVLDQDGKRRIKPLLKLGTGASYYEDNTPSGLFLQKYGFTEFGVSSKASTPSLRRAENELMSELIPALAKLAQAREKQLIEQKKDMPFIQAEIRGIITSNLTPIRSMFKEASYMKILDLGKDISDEKRAKLSNKFLLEKYRVKFKRLPKNVRQWGLKIFEQHKGEPVDPNSGSDYITAFTLAKSYKDMFTAF